MRRLPLPASLWVQMDGCRLPFVLACRVSSWRWPRDWLLRGLWIELRKSDAAYSLQWHVMHLQLLIASENVSHKLFLHRCPFSICRSSSWCHVRNVSVTPPKLLLKGWGLSFKSRTAADPSRLGYTILLTSSCCPWYIHCARRCCRMVAT